MPVLKKVYYYIICLGAIFVFLWGTIDFVSAGMVLITYQPPPPRFDFYGLPEGISTLEALPPSVDEYFQRKVSFDRLTEGMIKILLAGGVFYFCRKRVEEEEGEK